MGKSCLRFQRAEDLALEATGRLIKGTTPEKYIERYESSRRSQRKDEPKKRIR